MDCLKINKENINYVMFSKEKELQQIVMSLPVKPVYVKTPSLLDYIFTGKIESSTVDSENNKPREVLSFDLFRLYVAISFLITTKCEKSVLKHCKEMQVKKEKLVEDIECSEMGVFDNDSTTLKLLNIYEKFIYDTKCIESDILYSLDELKTLDIVNICSDLQTAHLKKISYMQDNIVNSLEKLYLN